MTVKMLGVELSIERKREGEEIGAGDAGMKTECEAPPPPPPPPFMSPQPPMALPLMPRPASVSMPKPPPPPTGPPRRRQVNKRGCVFPKTNFT